MTDRDFALTNKAACYGVAALGVCVCIVFLFLGSAIAFPGGVFAGIFCVLVAELLIDVPDKSSGGHND